MANYSSGSQSNGTQLPPSQGLAYDPDMDVNEVRRLRSKYRDLLSTQAGPYHSADALARVLPETNAQYDYFQLLRPLETRANLANIKVDSLIDDVARTTTMFTGGKHKFVCRRPSS